jgi:hypothetical protein
MALDTSQVLDIYRNIHSDDSDFASRRCAGGVSEGNGRNIIP